MASIASSTSPIPGHSFPRAASSDGSESWAFLEDPTFDSMLYQSPASGSLQSWQVLGGQPGHGGQNYAQSQYQNSPAAVSPLNMGPYDQQQQPQQQQQQQQQHVFPLPTSYPEQPNESMMAMSRGFQRGQSENDSQPHSAYADSSRGFMFTEQDFNEFPQYYNGAQSVVADDMNGMSSFQVPQQSDLGIPQQFQSGPDVESWNPTNLKQEDASFFMEEFTSQSHTPPSVSSGPTSSPRSPAIKEEPGKALSPLRKVKNSGKIEKKKADSSGGKFFVMTPSLINAQQGKPNPYECFEAMRMTSKGRKGPLANETKESALQVRRLGACFCCHARKVKCDKERPCKNCKKLTAQVPQVVCWQFPDFMPVLFPEFIRGHFKRDQMTKFIGDNISGFKIGGIEKPCEVELFSGMRFGARLVVKANFFNAKTPDVLQHWHMHVERDRIDLQPRGSAPIGIDLENNGQREELRRKTRDYVQMLIFEPHFAEQVTDAFRHTELPRKVLKIVQTFAHRTDSIMVKRALSIYAMHYVMTRHLCLTQNSITNLQHTNLVSQNFQWITPRVLNRQIKSLIDELLVKEMQGLFDIFSKSLKPKSRKEWAPCLASFLVLCLFMEAVETAADNFVISQNEISIRNRTPPEYRREFALGLCKEVENMPFRQFAFQFHQIYQTHCKDVSTKSFNPLMDESLLEQGELDDAAVDMVKSLGELLRGDSWHELDFLVGEPILPNSEGHPYPMDVSLNYTGRLVAKFLLSFEQEKYLFV